MFDRYYETVKICNSYRIIINYARFNWLIASHPFTVHREIIAPWTRVLLLINIYEPA